MRKTIWTLWLQGEDAAPPIVKHCLNSWRVKNPGWDFRCLSAGNIRQYIDIPEQFEPTKKTITATSFSDMVRLLLLHEFGGVWVDATCMCNTPLDEYITTYAKNGFFAYSNPAPDRPIASWFLASSVHNPITSAWLAKALTYWESRSETKTYFWLHKLYNLLLAESEIFQSTHNDMPAIEAHAAHSLLHSDGFATSALKNCTDIDWSSPVFKLSYRHLHPAPHPQSWLSLNVEQCQPEPTQILQKTLTAPHTSHIASLKVSTENLGDHIQIIGQQRLSKRFGIEADILIDRDIELETAPTLSGVDERVPIILNGWFKSGHNEWPPNAKLHPLIIGFHIRPFQCPPLLEEPSIEYFKKFEPIGARDAFTSEALSSRGVSTYISGCLSQSLNKRLPEAQNCSKTFVVSRDDRILSYLPSDLGEVTFVNHYSSEGDFYDKMSAAEQLLLAYKQEAKLIITTLLHCALPAIAMGIPVIVFYPINHEEGHRSDKERFSSLKDLTPIYHLNDMESVEWNPSLIDTSDTKLAIIDKMRHYFDQLGLVHTQPVGPFADPASLPPGMEE